MIIRNGYTEYSLDEMGKLPTRELLVLYDKLRAYRQNALKNFEEKQDALQEAKWTLELYDDYIPILKEVLSTREHIPNKQEAKVIRQEKAKAKRNR